MVNIEKVKAEIERRYKEFDDKAETGDGRYYQGVADGLDLAEQIIESTQEEPESDDFEELLKSDNSRARKIYEKGKADMKAELMNDAIECFVARDGDATLRMHGFLPDFHNMGQSPYDKFWRNDEGDDIEIPKELFPEIHCCEGPVLVKFVFIKEK